MTDKPKRKNNTPSRRFKFLVAFALLLIMLGLAAASYIALSTTAQFHAAGTDAARTVAAVTLEYERCTATHVYVYTDNLIQDAARTALEQAGVDLQELQASYLLDQCAVPTRRSATTIRLSVATAALEDTQGLAADLVNILTILDDVDDDWVNVAHLSLRFREPDSAEIINWQMRYADAIASYPEIAEPLALFEAGLR